MDNASPADASPNPRQKEEQDPAAASKPEPEDSSSDDSEDENTNPDGPSGPKPVINIFKDIITKVKDFDVKVENGPEKLNQLVVQQLEAQQDRLSETTPIDKKTILHVIAETAGENKKKGVNNLESLINELARLDSKLAWQQDNEKMTPLHRAIKKRAGRVVEFMSEALGDKLDEVLQKEDKLKNNCLHYAAFEAKHKNGIIAGLIPRVRSPITFLAKNLDKLTPMHIAVKYDDCSSKRLDIIEAMITHWDLKYLALNEQHAALNVNVLNEDGDECEGKSVFCYHQWTREEAAKDAKKDTQDNVETERNARKTKHPQSPEKPITGVPQVEKPPAPRSTPKSNQAPASTPARVDDQKPLYPPGPIRRGTALDLEAQNPKQDPPSSHKPGNSVDEKKMKPEAVKAKSPAEITSDPNPPKMTQEEAANRIRDRLKMHYMCTRNDHRQILTFLYGQNEGKGSARAYCNQC